MSSKQIPNEVKRVELTPYVTFDLERYHYDINVSMNPIVRKVYWNEPYTTLSEVELSDIKSSAKGLIIELMYILEMALEELEKMQ